MSKNDGGPNPIDLEALPLTSKALAMALQHIRICAPHPTVDAALEDAVTELTARRARDAEVQALVAKWRSLLRVSADGSEYMDDESIARGQCADELANLTGATP
jgi:hypothetical protein